MYIIFYFLTPDSKEESEETFQTKGGLSEDAEELHPDQMPKYARSYILPKVIKRSNLLEAKRRRQEQKRHEKKKSLETTGRGKRKVSSYVSPDDAADEKFKWGMIKASLEYERSKLPPSLQEESDEGSDDDRRRGGRVPGKNESARDFYKRSTATKPEEESVLDGSSKVIPAPNSLLPVKGPGQLKRYIKYVKEENYVPVPVLEPERAVDHGLFAKKGKKGVGGGGNEGGGDGSSSSWRVSNVSQAHNSITAQYENIIKLVSDAMAASAEHRAQLKSRKTSSLHHRDLDALENVDLNMPQVSRASSRNTSRGSSRVPSRVSSGITGKVKRKKGRFPLPSLDIEDIDEEDKLGTDHSEGQQQQQQHLGPPPAASSAGDSGYSTGSYPTSVDAAVSNGAKQATSSSISPGPADMDDLFGLGLPTQKTPTNLFVGGESGDPDDELEQLMQEAERIAQQRSALAKYNYSQRDWDSSNDATDGWSTRNTNDGSAGNGNPNPALPDYIPKDSEVYREWMNANILQDAMEGKNLLGMLEEKKYNLFEDESTRRQREEMEGESRGGGEGGEGKGKDEGDSGTIDYFIDRDLPFDFLSERHPVLQEVVKLIQRTKTDRGMVRGTRWPPQGNEQKTGSIVWLALIICSTPIPTHHPINLSRCLR